MTSNSLLRMVQGYPECEDDCEDTGASGQGNSRQANIALQLVQESMHFHPHIHPSTPRFHSFSLQNISQIHLTSPRLRSSAFVCAAIFLSYLVAMRATSSPVSPVHTVCPSRVHTRSSVGTLRISNGYLVLRTGELNAPGPGP